MDVESKTRPGKLVDAVPADPAIGKSLARVDGRERVTGRARYAADITRPDMAHAKVLRSPHAHAVIKRIDTSAATALPGVLAVVTAEDFPDLPQGASIPMGETGYDMWGVSRLNMARGKVHWVGQPVAALAARDPHIAAQALELIEVEYEVLDAVTSIAEAIHPDAPVLWDNLITRGLDETPQKPSNIAARTVVSRADAKAAIAGADATGRVSVTVDTAHQGYIEPQAMVAEITPDGFATVYTSTQGQFTTELMIARMLDWPMSKLKVVPMEVGGAFGGKISIHGEALALRLAQKSGRPVKLVLSREEVLQGGSGPTMGAMMEIEVGAKSDGTITGIHGVYRVDSGGLPGLNPSLLMQASAAMYQTPALWLEGYDVVTNKPRTEAYRAPGGIQGAFAMEQAMDELCLALDMDPLEFRRRNAAVTGSTMPIGTPFPAIGLTTILDAVAEHPCWTTPLEPGAHPRGRGLALGYWRGTSMTSACHITIGGDGRPVVTMGAVDISGTRTTMTQVAADQFGIAPDDVYVQTGDSKTAGYSDGAAGSRVARTMAAAIVEASRDVIDQLRPRAARLLQSEPENLTFADGAFRVSGGPGTSISLAELMQETLTEGAVIGRGTSTKLPLGVEIGAHICDVEVDPDTGQVTILRYTAFQDVGKALNPIAVEGQIEGSVVQGIGWALTEGYDYGADGRLRNASLLDYRLPTALDVPDIDCVIIETPVPDVPYGLRGVGEVPIVPVAGCVANAIRRAVGVRTGRMPMTPERLLMAMRAQGRG
ncbi:MAG: xanthine dehydrogenase family protein molybdopterin-binding subunit [Salinarimonas sp.]